MNKRQLSSLLFVALAAAGCEKTVDVNLNVIEPCDQENQALNGVRSLRVSANPVDLESGGFPGAEVDAKAFSTSAPDALTFPLEQELFITVHAYEGDVATDGAAALAAAPVSIGRSVPLDVGNGQALDITLPVGLMGSFGKASYKDDDGVTQCAELDSGAAAAGRHGHTATYLPTIGKVLILGGAVWFDDPQASPDLPQCDTFNDGGVDTVKCFTVLKTAELFDPATGKFTALPELPNARSYHTATLLPDGRVLVVGGFTLILRGDGTPPGLEPLINGFVFDPAAIDGGDPYGAPIVFSSQRAMHTATLIPDANQVAIIGGCQVPGCSPFGLQEGTAEPTDPTMRVQEVVELYDIGSGSAVSVPLEDSEQALVARAMHAASLVGDFLIVSGGVNTDGPRCNLEIFEVNGGGGLTRQCKVSESADLGRTCTIDDDLTTLTDCPMGHTQVTVNRDTIALIGGIMDAPGGTPNPDATGSNQVQFWNTLGVSSGLDTTLLTGRWGHSTVTLADGSVLVMGGHIAQGGATAELLDLQPAGGYTATNINLPLLDARVDMGVTLMQNNQVLVTGGYIPGSATTSTSAEIYFGN